MVDKITDKYLVEIKKSDADKEAARWQVYYYLYILKKKGIIKKGKLEFVENNQGKKTEYLDLYDKKEKEVEKLLKEIEEFISKEEIPKFKKIKACSKCAYYEYCNI